MILQINFTLNVPVSEYKEMARSFTQPVADAPGLIWKIWLLNEATLEAGGIYHFDSQASLDAYLNGPVVAQVKAWPAIRNIAVKQFGVMPEVTELTRGPVSVPSTAHA